MTASSYGFGEAIRAALTLARHRLVLALGGSASTDGGIGMLAAFGYRFRDRSGTLLAPTAREPATASTASTLQPRRQSRRDQLIVAGDVTSPLLGPTGAAAVFGPQKGATAAQVARLDDGLNNLVDAYTRSGFQTPRPSPAPPAAGGAGGIGFAAMLLGATAASGAEYFLDLLDFDGLVADADLVTRLSSGRARNAVSRNRWVEPTRFHPRPVAFPAWTKSDGNGNGRVKLPRPSRGCRTSGSGHLLNCAAEKKGRLAPRNDG